MRSGPGTETWQHRFVSVRPRSSKPGGWGRASQARAAWSSLPARAPFREGEGTHPSQHSPVGPAGKIEGGAVRPGMRVLLMPGHLEATVRGLEVDGASCSLARAGDTVDLGLTGVEPEQLHTGMVVCSPQFPIRRVKRFQCQAVVVDPPVPLLRGQGGLLQAHNARSAAAVTGLIALLDGRTGDVTRQKPRCLLRGSTGLVEIEVQGDGICLERYSDYRPLGRIVLRDNGRTVLVGIVTDVLEST